MVTQAERRAATRARILDAAEQSFARDGYEGTSTDAILEAAGISRGALYHHFATKQAVFEAVFLRLSEAAIERAARGSARSDPPLEALVRTCLRWLREVRKPVTAAILIAQGPQVLGWKRARDLEAQTSLEPMIRGIRRAQKAGEIEVESAELTARLLNAVLAEAALATLDRPSRLSVAAIDRSVRQAIVGIAGLSPESGRP